MSKLSKMAEEIRAQESKKNQDERGKIEAEADRYIQNIENEFLHTFPELIPLLQEEGISWRGGLQDRRYPSLKGAFIEFTYKGKTLKMDFANRGSYRLEFIPYSANGSNHGSMTFSKWPANKFVTWIDENLINPLTS